MVKTLDQILYLYLFFVTFFRVNPKQRELVEVRRAQLFCCKTQHHRKLIADLYQAHPRWES